MSFSKRKRNVTFGPPGSHESEPKRRRNSRSCEYSTLSPYLLALQKQYPREISKIIYGYSTFSEEEYEMWEDLRTIHDMDFDHTGFSAQIIDFRIHVLERNGAIGAWKPVDDFKKWAQRYKESVPFIKQLRKLQFSNTSYADLFSFRPEPRNKSEYSLKWDFEDFTTKIYEMMEIVVLTNLSIADVKEMISRKYSTTW